MICRRRVDEVVSRIAAIFAYYRGADGELEVCPALIDELGVAVADIDAIDDGGRRVRPEFFRSLDSELIARHGPETGSRYAELVRQSSFRDGPEALVSSRTRAAGRDSRPRRKSSRIG